MSTKVLEQVVGTHKAATVERHSDIGGTSYDVRDVETGRLIHWRSTWADAHEQAEKYVNK